MARKWVGGGKFKGRHDAAFAVEIGEVVRREARYGGQRLQRSKPDTGLLVACEPFDQDFQSLQWIRLRVHRDDARSEVVLACLMKDAVFAGLHGALMTCQRRVEWNRSHAASADGGNTTEKA